jgi:hypothetical protein
MSGNRSVVPKNYFLNIVNMEITRYATNFELCQRIATVNNMVAIQVPGCGDCQYEAVIACLKSLQYVESFTVAKLRRRVADEILADSLKYEPFLSDSEGSITAYAQSVLHGEWGDELSLTAIASSLNIHITVYQFSCSGQSINEIGNDDSEYRIYMTLDNRNELTAHYGALIARPSSLRECVRDSVHQGAVQVQKTAQSTDSGVLNISEHRSSQQESG